MQYIGDYKAGSTVYVFFSTNLGTGARSNFATAIETADFKIYKDGSATPRSSASGTTVVEAIDSKVGIYKFEIDLSDNTDAGFYAVGSDYTVVLYPDEQIDSVDVSKVLAQFSIDNRSTASIETKVDTIDTNVDAIKVKTDALPEGMQTNTAYANFQFVMVDDTDGFTPETGLTVTATRVIDDGSYSACANAVVEIANGSYRIDLAAADLNGKNVTLLFTATGARTRLITLVLAT